MSQESENKEPVFLERPKSESTDHEEEENSVFGQNKSDSPKRKVQIIPKSNIKINVGTGKAAILSNDEIKWLVHL